MISIRRDPIWRRAPRDDRDADRGRGRDGDRGDGERRRGGRLGRNARHAGAPSSSRGGAGLRIVVTSGIARVAAFIGVGVFSALAVAAVKTGSPFGYLLILLGIAAPLAGSSALARILAGPRHRLSPARRDADRAVPQARHAGPGLSGAPPLGRSGGAGDAGHRDDRIFLRPYRGAGAGGDPRAVDGARHARRRRLADRAGAVAVRAVRRRWRRC